MASPDTTRGVGGPTGWAVFAGVILVILGFLNFFWGLAAILEDQNVVVGGSGVIITDLTAWGWASLIVGTIQVLVGFGLFSAAQWARWLGIFFAAVAAIGQIGIVTAFPIWSLIIIILCITVIYQLAVNWEEPAGY